MLRLRHFLASIIFFMMKKQMKHCSAPPPLPSAPSSCDHVPQLMRSRRSVEEKWVQGTDVDLVAALGEFSLAAQRCNRTQRPWWISWVFTSLGRCEANSRTMIKKQTNKHTKVSNIIIICYFLSDKTLECLQITSRPVTGLLLYKKWKTLVSSGVSNTWSTDCWRWHRIVGNRNDGGNTNWGGWDFFSLWAFWFFFEVKI